MDNNQLTQADLAVLAAWTPRMAKQLDKDAAGTPKQQPRVGHLLQMLADFLTSAGTISLNVINPSAPIAANTLLTVNGYDHVTGLPTVGVAAPTGIAAIGITEAALATGATCRLRKQFLLVDSGLDTSGATLNDTVYLAAAGALSLAIPSSGIKQAVGFVHTIASSGTVRIEIQAPVSMVPSKHASTHVGAGNDVIADAVASGNSGLLSGADKLKLNGLKGTVPAVPADEADSDHPALLANFLGGWLPITPSAARALTTPTAAQIVGGLTAPQVGQFWDILLVNKAAFTVTLTAGAGVTLVGAGTVGSAIPAIIASQRFRVRLDNVTGGAEAVTIVRG